jgi:hypothetical protein
VRAVRRRIASDHRPAEREVGDVGVACMAPPTASVLSRPARQLGDFPEGSKVRLKVVNFTKGES